MRFGLLALRLAAAGLGSVLFLALVRLPGWFPIAALTLTILAALRPFEGLRVTAALVPLGGATATLLHFPTPLSESIVVALIAGALLRAAIRPLRVPGRILGLPLLLAVTVCGSYVVQLAVRRAAVGPDQFSQELMHLLSGGYLASTVVSAQLKAAAVFLEGLALFCISAVIVQNDRTRLSRFVWVMVVGATGAAALNVLRLASAALAAGEPWTAVVRLAGTLRINVQYADVNAAGSYFAMLVCLAAGLALHSPRWLRPAWAACCALLAAALWLTSSRAAVLALFVAALVVTVFAGHVLNRRIS